MIQKDFWFHLVSIITSVNLFFFLFLCESVSCSWPNSFRLSRTVHLKPLSSFHWHRLPDCFLSETWLFKLILIAASESIATKTKRSVALISDSSCHSTCTHPFFFIHSKRVSKSSDEFLFARVKCQLLLSRIHLILFGILCCVIYKLRDL